MRSAALGAGIARAGGVFATATATAYGFSRAIGSLVGPAMSYEQAMANVAAVTGATNDELKSLDKSVMQARKGLNISPTEAANAQLFLAMAGLKAPQIAKALRPALEMGIAGGFASRSDC